MQTLLHHTKAKLEAKSTPKGQLIADLMDATGWSRDTCYRKLKAVGYGAPRKERADKRQSRVARADLETVAALLSSSVRANGKQTMDVPTARGILASNGIALDVSTSQLSRLLKAQGLDGQSVRKATPHVGVRSLHPNHVHQVDVSLCLLYYTPDHKQRVISDAEAYKNKPFMVGKERLKVWRYVLTDHYSSSILVRYYNASGETAVNMYDFLLYCWAKKADKLLVQHGVPKVLVWDKGSANMAKTITYALKCLGVHTLAHAPGNPRAKGQVEVSHNLVEKLLESRLRLVDLASVAELNTMAEQWAGKYNSNNLAGYNSMLGRAGTARTVLWRTITQEQLVELPDSALCRRLLTLEAKPRTVSGALTITYPHPSLPRVATYDVRDVPGIYVGARVDAMPLFTESLGTIVVVLEDYDGITHTAYLTPIAHDAAGFRVDAPIIGVQMTSHKNTVADKTNKRLAENIAHMKTDKAFDVMADIKQAHNLFAMPKSGRALELPSHMQVAPEQVLSVAQIAQHLHKMYKSQWQPHYYAVLEEVYPNGLVESQVGDAWALLTKPKLTVIKEA